MRVRLFHLLASVADTGEAAVGARGCQRPGYGGHVFWDADVFVLPALAAMRPARPGRCWSTGSGAWRSLAAGRRPGKASGAAFPWESARDGDRRDAAFLPRP